MTKMMMSLLMQLIRGLIGNEMIKLKEILNKIQESPDSTVSPVTNKDITYYTDPCYTIILNKSMGVGTKDINSGDTHGELYRIIKDSKLEGTNIDDEVIFIPNKNVVYGEFHPYGCQWESVDNFVHGRIYANDNIICFWQSLEKIKICLPVLKALMKYYKLDITKFDIEYYDKSASTYPRTPSDKIL